MGSRSIKSNFQRIGREKQFASQNSPWLSPPKKSNCIMCSSIFSLLFDGKKFRQRLISWKPPWQQGFLSISKNFVFLPYISKTSASEEILTLPHEKSGEKKLVTTYKTKVTLFGALPKKIDPVLHKNSDQVRQWTKSSMWPNKRNTKKFQFLKTWKHFFIWHLDLF